MTAVLLLPWLTWILRGPDGTPTPTTLDIPAIFADRPPTWGQGQVLTPATDLGTQAAAALTWLQQSPDPPHAGALAELGVTAEDLQATLAFVARIAAEDAGKPTQRLQDPAFLAEHFRVIHWTPDAPQGETRIRLTRYVIWQVEGTPTRDDAHAYALYAVPDDEQGLTEAEATGRDLDRFRYTRQQVLAGVYEPGGAAAGRAKPLVWLSRAQVHEALMQGTIEVRHPNGSTHLYNVARPNAWPYVKGLPSEDQKRLWYFREVDAIYGWGRDDAHIPLTPGVAVAGDVYNLGVGQLLALSWPGAQGPSVRLVVLADTGGAFQPNLHQLDLLLGSFPSRAAFNTASAALPDRVSADLLVLRAHP